MTSPYQRAVRQYHRDELDKRMLVAIRLYMAEHSYAPSIRNLCDLTGTPSTYTVFKSLRRLEQQGKIVRDKGAARTIRLLDGAL